MARKARVFSDSEIRELKDMITKYREEHGIAGKIRYMEMFRFNHELYTEGKFNEFFKEDFWRKSDFLGRKLIDENNKLFANNHVADLDQNVPIANVYYIVDTYKKEEDLIKHLLPLQTALEKSLQREKALKNKNDQLTDELNQKKINQEDLINRCKNYEDALFRLLRYSANDQNKLVDVLNVNNKDFKHNDIVKRSLDTLFSDPLYLYNWFDEKIDKKQEAILDSTNYGNTISLANYRVNATKKKTAYDDLKWDE